MPKRFFSTVAPYWPYAVELHGSSLLKGREGGFLPLSESVRDLNNLVSEAQGVGVLPRQARVMTQHFWASMARCGLDSCRFESRLDALPDIGLGTIVIHLDNSCLGKVQGNGVQLTMIVLDALL